MSNKKIKESWGTRLGLILAMAGNAVGLGNFLRFPVQAVQNGGGAFLIPYLICFLLMGIPLLWVEWATGRFGGNKGHHSTPFILDSMAKQSLWKYVGVFGIFTNLAVAAYYCYIESWTMTYVIKTLLGHFINTSPDKVSAAFDAYLDFVPTFTGLPYEAIVAFIICVMLNAWVLSKGLVDGVEKVAKTHPGCCWSWCLSAFAFWFTLLNKTAKKDEYFCTLDDAGGQWNHCWPRCLLFMACASVEKTSGTRLIFRK
jgi:NSS family neurotransmitter:Na+ symporter